MSSLPCCFRSSLPALFRYISSGLVCPSRSFSLPLPTTIDFGFFFELVAGRNLSPAGAADFGDVPRVEAPQSGAPQKTFIMWIGPPPVIGIRFVNQTSFGLAPPGGKPARPPEGVTMGTNGVTIGSGRQS